MLSESAFHHKWYGHMVGHCRESASQLGSWISRSVWVVGRVTGMERVHSSTCRSISWLQKTYSKRHGGFPEWQYVKRPRKKGQSCLLYCQMSATYKKLKRGISHWAYTPYINTSAKPLEMLLIALILALNFHLWIGCSLSRATKLRRHPCFVLTLT